MSYTAFAHGKWILAGEHAVLRGAPALVFPIQSCGMKLEELSSEAPLELQLAGEKGEELKALAWKVVENAVQRCGRDLAQQKGLLRITSNLPIGAGLGASAALCAVMSRWCQHQGWLDEDSIYEFCRSLEDLFHGESSGVDVAVALSGQGLRFVRGQEREPLLPSWRPHFYLSFSGQRGATSDCVYKVKTFIQNDPERGHRVDERMRAAVLLAEASLANPKAGFGQMVEALDMANSCFEEWGLVEGSLKEHLELLKRSGAAAVKPTGSGGGGYILSLWEVPPPRHVQDSLITVF